MSLAAKLFSSNEVPFTTGISSKGFTDWSEDTVICCTASHRAVLPSWSLSSKSSLKSRSNVNSTYNLFETLYTDNNLVLSLYPFSIHIFLAHFNFLIYATLKMFKKNDFSLTIPPSQPPSHLCVCPYVLFALQQLTEHIFIPGHDGHM